MFGEHGQKPGLNFFFQAEDGIRDRLVTGVQTCALPIYLFIKLLEISSIGFPESPPGSLF